MPTRLRERVDRRGCRARRAAPFGDAFAREHGEAFLVDIGRDHRRALARKGQRAGAADAGRAAVTNARLPLRRSDMVDLLQLLVLAFPHCEDEATKPCQISFARLWLASLARSRKTRVKKVNDYPAPRRLLRDA